MHLSYSSYKNDINSFSSEEYKNLETSVSYSFFLEFIENYKEIENEDFKKPLFSQTNKFKKIPNTYKNYKYAKINRDNEEPKCSWSFENPLGEKEKITVLIKTYLNKISQDTYKKISSDFINELLLINNKDLFEILSYEIIDKCLFDNKYRSLYINLCYKIWNNRQIHFNTVNINEINNLFYWDNNNGPFTSELYAKNDIFNKNNFKKYFLNYIQKLFIKKDMYFDNLSDEEIFIKKKKIILLVELIGILYLEKYINFDIINIIIINLLHLNNNFSNIEEVEIEALYTLMKLIKDNKNNMNDLAEYKNIFSEFSEIIKQLGKNDISKRSLFFLNEIINILNDFSNVNIQKKINQFNMSSENTENLKNVFIEKMKEYNFDVNELHNIFKKINDENDKIELLYKSIDFNICKKNTNNKFLTLLNEISNKELFIIVFNKIISNLDDILLDSPCAKDKLLYIIDNLTIFDKDNKLDFTNKINSFVNSDDED